MNIAKIYKSSETYLVSKYMGGHWFSLEGWESRRHFASCCEHVFVVSVAAVCFQTKSIGCEATELDLSLSGSVENSHDRTEKEVIK